ncbi:MAG TPA: alpha/beta fold hydrolase [bacterium]|nr:alpha/beta fold hydrolase [bacterium]
MRSIRSAPPTRALAAMTTAAWMLLLLATCGSATKLSPVHTKDKFTIFFDLDVPEGATKAPLVVLCHQQERDRTSWEPLVAPLLAQGYAVLRLDHRGFGESRKEAKTPQELTTKARDSFHEDIAAAIRAAGKNPAVDNSRIAIIAAGFSSTYAARAARLNPHVKSLVFLGGYITAEDEDYLIAHPEMPVFIAVASGDQQGAEVARQHGAHLRGPHQEMMEIQPTPADPAHWRGTDGLTADTGLAELVVWKLEENFPPK